MKFFYFVRAITTVAVFAFTALRVFAQPAGANMSNAINIGTLSAGVAFSDTKNNSTANGYGNDMGQPSDDLFISSRGNAAEMSIFYSVCKIFY